jgi:hypothetical protein
MASALGGSAAAAATRVAASLQAPLEPATTNLNSKSTNRDPADDDSKNPNFRSVSFDSDGEPVMKPRGYSQQPSADEKVDNKSHRRDLTTEESKTGAEKRRKSWLDSKSAVPQNRDVSIGDISMGNFVGRNV